MDARVVNSGYFSLSSRKKGTVKLDKSPISVDNAFMSHAQQAQIPGSFRFVRAYAKINLTLDVLGKRYRWLSRTGNGYANH